jgi:thioredoxin reductase (NADPH)
MMIPAQAVALDCTKAASTGELGLTLSDGRALRARAVVLASGAQYRRPDVLRLREFEGRGVWYWASSLKAKMCADAEVALIGGGNSAGQTAVFLAQHAARVHILVRGAGLAATMSRYLIDRIEATPNIELHPFTQLTQLRGDLPDGLSAIAWRDGRTGVEVERPIRHVFVFVGADPETQWLAGCGATSTRTASCLPTTPRRSGTRIARPPRSSRASPACSRSATCARARSSRWAAPSAKVPPSWRTSINTWPWQASGKQ